MTYRLIVFDWDGTIIDSAATIVDCIRESARDMGLPVPGHERASHVIGLGLHDSLRLAVANPELVGSRTSLEAGLMDARMELNRVKSARYLGSLVGTLGADPSCH